MHRCDVWAQDLAFVRHSNKSTSRPAQPAPGFLQQRFAGPRTGQDPDAPAQGKHPRGRQVGLRHKRAGLGPTAFHYEENIPAHGLPRSSLSQGRETWPIRDRHFHAKAAAAAAAAATAAGFHQGEK